MATGTGGRTTTRKVPTRSGALCRTALAAAFLTLASIAFVPLADARAQEAADAAVQEAPSIDLRAVLVAVKTRAPARARDARDAAAPRLGADQVALLDALLLAREGDAEAAERALRALLTEDPSRRLVRFELAQLLIARERYTAARFQLDLLTASEPDPAVRRVYAALDRRIARLRPWEVDVSFGAAPRTNANRGSGEDALADGGTIAEADRAAAAVGFTYAASAARRFAITPTIDLYARGFVSGVEYEVRGLASNRVGTGLFARLNGAAGGRVDVGLDLSRDYANGNVLDGLASATNVTPYASFHRPIGRRFALGGVARLTYADHTGERPDGWRGTVSGRVSFAPQAGRSVSLGGAYRFDRSGFDYQRYDAYEATASAYAELPLGVSAALSGAVGRRDFDGVISLTGEAREDVFARAALSLTKRDWAVRGFAPRLGVSYEWNSSNLALYTFDDVGVTLGVSRSF